MARWTGARRAGGQTGMRRERGAHRRAAVRGAYCDVLYAVQHPCPPDSLLNHSPAAPSRPQLRLRALPAAPAVPPSQRHGPKDRQGQGAGGAGEPAQAAEPKAAGRGGRHAAAGQGCARLHGREGTGAPLGAHRLGARILPRSCPGRTRSTRSNCTLPAARALQGWPHAATRRRSLSAPALPRCHRLLSGLPSSPNPSPLVPLAPPALLPACQN